MSDKKIYSKLPVVQQTPVIKNFFESTVEQLFSKANVDNIQGYIGSQTSADLGISGKYIPEPTATKRFYGLSPTINTVNEYTNTSENLIFYDELIDTLETYGVDVKNHNKIFSENFSTFLPPVDQDKLINYSEYYWYPQGPSTIVVEGTAANPIDIDTDVIGNARFSPVNGKEFRNGMIVEFSGDYVIPQSKVGVTYIVEGVGTSIMLLPKNDNYSTRFTTLSEDGYDNEPFTFSDDGVTYSAGTVSNIIVNNPGVGYVDPVLFIYDDVSSESLGDEVYGNPSHAYYEFVNTYVEDNGDVVHIVNLEPVFNTEVSAYTLTEHATIKSIYETYRTGNLAVATVALTSTRGIDAVIADSGSDYSGEIKVAVFDQGVTHDANVAHMVAEGVLVTNTITLIGDTANVYVGQQVTGFVDGFVTQVIERDDPMGILPAIVLDRYIELNLADFASSPTLTFRGVGFDATIRMDDAATIGTNEVEILNTQARLGINPNSPQDYYFVGGTRGWDRDINGDGIGDIKWAGIVTSGDPDYTVQARGAINRNVWSRVNFWYHRDNFKDAGDSLPSRDYRANRPILEFDRDLELFNHGERSIGTIIFAATEQSYDQLDGTISGTPVDGVPMDGATFIFPTAPQSVAKHLYTSSTVVSHPAVVITSVSGAGASAYAHVEESGANTGYISSIEVTNPGSGYTDGDVTITITAPYGAGATAVATVAGGQITDITVTDGGMGYYALGTLRIERIGDPINNPAGARDGDVTFIPFEAQPGDVTHTLSGEYNIGKEFIFNGVDWYIAQEKVSVNQAPLFNLYDYNGNSLADQGVYPGTTFAGNKLFGYATELPANETDVILSTTPDTVLGFPLVYRQFKASSEIVFENFQFSQNYTYQPVGSRAPSQVTGYLYYKLLKDEPEYYGYWKNVDNTSVQRILTTYIYTQVEYDRAARTFSIGCIPARNANKNSGYDITVRVNGTTRTDFTYGNSRPGYIDFNVNNLDINDFIEISAYSETGLLSTSSDSKFELPLSWAHNYRNEDITYTSEPQYLTHFRNYMRGQLNFSGTSLGSNNFNSTAKDPKFATDIVQTNQDIILGAFLVDDQPHNLVDAIRFTANEYVKYKNRVKAEIDKLYASRFYEGMTTESVLEQVLRNVISYKVGQNVFNRTYIVPFGDNYALEEFTIALGQTEVVLANYADLNKIESSLLVYKNQRLMTVDRDYVITNYSPITLDLSPSNITQGDRIVVKLYDEERDSAQCPPTPSTMGLYQLYQPEILVDNSYADPVTVIVGHDGSRTPIKGDYRDEVLLEFETRIYNSAKAEFRAANSLPEYNYAIVRGGAFRDTGYSYNEWYDLLRHQYSNWVSTNHVDPVVNEFFDESSEWTWNYGSEEIPGHWKGWYEFYYDTFRPHTHPWEMLGFTEQPLWWNDQYGTDYGSNNAEMWDDLEQGIIRQGDRANTANDRYLTNNPFRRVGLHEIVPVDADGNLIAPYRLTTTASTTATRQWTNTDTGNHDGYRTSSYLNIDGINVSYDSSNVYVQSRALVNHAIDNTIPGVAGHLELYGSSIEEQDISYTLPRQNLNIVTESGVAMGVNAPIAVMVNGLPMYNISYGRTWNNTGSWTYDQVRVEDKYQLGHIEAESGLLHYHVVLPEILGLTDWSTTEHSPIVGWAFDGLPIYGPYGYNDPEDINSEIVRINTPWKLRSGVRGDGPGGAYTGTFIEDYYIDALVENSHGYTNRYNARYGFTPDSPTTKIWHYVTTVDANHTPVFPYHVGGGVTNFDQWAGKFYGTPVATGRIGAIDIVETGGLYTDANTAITITGDGSGATATAIITDGRITGVQIDNPGSNYTHATVTVTGDGVRAKLVAVLAPDDNLMNAGYVNPDATMSYTSEYNAVYTYTLDKIRGAWKFGDGAPVENVWKYSESYPFAVAEALLLAKPGRFATVFSDPTKLFRPSIDKRQLLNVDTGMRWKFWDKNEFAIHGDTDADGNFITNIGYTQFINSWFAFQGLDMVTDFVNPLRTLNMKLAHRMSGYIDKDTMIARTDQYSSSGNATSLIIPKENITIDIHSSNYKTRNFYSGVIIEKTAAGFKVRGFDKTRNYFLVLASDLTGKRERIDVGGKPVDYVQWNPNTTYRKDSIVFYAGRYYQALLNISDGNTFDKSLWKRLPSLPQVGAARATLYQETTGIVNRINYEHEFTEVQDLYDFLIGLGRYQASLGFDFGDYNPDISDVSDWQYAAKQFLFWTTGKWEIGNTLELSPMASQARFVAPRGFIAKINRVDREQFSIVSQDGSAIDPRDCTIVREDDYIEIIPPAGLQVYGVMLFTKELEHAFIVDNITEFNDVIYDPLLFQKHSRIKLKARRTAGWTGKFLSEGFLILGEELAPNLDNMAETMGRYHELGFIPVEKQLYEASRKLFGYQERDYLRELDIVDDQQFDFYRGMIQSKGTTVSLDRIAKSSAVVQGNVTIYDEWALKVADFGDTENEQSIELRINKSELVQDPQLVTMVLPESVTNMVTRVDVLESRYTYPAPPGIIISSPVELGGIQATAVPVMDSNNKIASVIVTNPGSGYPENAVANVIAANVQISLGAGTFANASAHATANTYIDLDKVSTELTLNDHIAGSGNVVITVTAESGNITVDDIVDAINGNALVNSNITASSISTHYADGDNVSVGYNIILTGADFSVVDGANIALDDGRYQPQQRYPISTTVTTDDYATSESDIFVYVNGTFVDHQVLDSEGNVTATNWSYIPGNTAVTQSDNYYPTIDVDSDRIEGSILFPVSNTSVTFDFADFTIDAGNLEKASNGQYKFVEVYINDIRVYNSLDTYTWADLTDDGVDNPTLNVTTYGTLFTLAEDSITFPDISRLPRSVLTPYFNPPLGYDADGKQRDTVFGFTPDTVIKIVQRATVEFDESYQGDLPGATLLIQVLANEGIAVRVEPRRVYDITPDDATDDVILIDIDDATRFLKKPLGIRNYQIWPTTSEVDHTGVIDKKYATIPNAGYVNAANVNFRAFDLSSLPDLYGNDVVIKPRTDDLIHVAIAENKDWNVYKLSKIAATKSYLFTGDDGVTSLLTDYSLFNYLDTNQIGEPNTGRYLDYFLTLQNANVSDQVVVWTNESIVQSKQYDVNDFKAPRMVEARIASIGPLSLTAITNVEPASGRRYTGVTITPDTEGDWITVRGNNFTEIKDFDQIVFYDNVGTQYNKPASQSVAGNVLTFDATGVDYVTITNVGAGYQAVPDVTFSASPSGDTATGTATIDGSVDSVVVNSDSGDFTNESGFGAGNVVFTSATGAGAEATSAVVNAQVIGFTITDGGTGYDPASPPTVTITGANISAATAEIVANVDISAGGEILGIRPVQYGSGYDSDTVTVTIGSPSSGRTATATAIVYGNVAITVTAGGSGYTEIPEVSIEIADKTVDATAVMDATVTGVVITNPGTGYTGTPTVTFTGANTTPAAGTVTVYQGVTELESEITLRGIGNVSVRIDGTANANLEYRIEPALTPSEQETLDTVNRVLRTDYTVTNFNSVSGTFDIVVPELADANVLSNIDFVGYKVTAYQDFDDTTYYATSVTPTSFRVERPATEASVGASFIHMNRSTITAEGHGQRVGDIVRIQTNTFNGMYRIDGATANTFTIQAPYIEGFTSGSILQEGLEITTVGPHGITPLYAAQGKRIAVHFAEPLYYNKVYPISQVTPETIVVAGYWPKDTRKHVFYEEKTGMLNGSNPYEAGVVDAANATNVINITNNVRLNDHIALYKSNSALISSAYITVKNSEGIAIISPEALPSNTSISTEIIMVRQQDRASDRYPLVTTLDHGTVTVNGVTIAVDSFNNKEAVASSINRAIKLREQFVNADENKMGMSILMLKDPKTPVEGNRSANQINNYGPYVRDADIIRTLTNNELEMQGNLVVGSSTETNVDPSFRQPSIKVGPTRGLVYTDEVSGITFYWEPRYGAYSVLRYPDTFTAQDIANYDTNNASSTTEAFPAPEYHSDTNINAAPISPWFETTPIQISEAANPDVAIAYRAGSVVSYEQKFYVAVADVSYSNNIVFTESYTNELTDVTVTLWAQISDPNKVQNAALQFLVLQNIPGNGPLDVTRTAPGYQQANYNMHQEVTFLVEEQPLTLPKFRLEPNRFSAYYVYQAVQNDWGDVYYSLVDKCSPPMIPHDYYGTVDAYSNFYNYPKTTYWYDNEIIPTVNVDNQITDVKDPIKLQLTGTVVNLPPVEPAIDLAGQLVPEPFAMADGNSTDAIMNYYSLPKVKIESASTDAPAVIMSLRPGNDKFLNWTAGYEPGQRTPTATGPGPQIGINGLNTIMGYGRGYYEVDDDHLPDDYPLILAQGYDKPQPRFAYNRRFSVSPAAYNYEDYDLIEYEGPDGTRISIEEYDRIIDDAVHNEGVTDEESIMVNGYPASEWIMIMPTINLVDESNEDINNTGLRPEEIFVACFWTEPHTYINQLIGWDYTAIDANGLPKPLYGDYLGTVTRYKYIRLTELPPNVITQRIIPDTGWAGRPWNNYTIDSMLATEKPITEIWDIFTATPVTGGSTGDANEGTGLDVLLTVNSTNPTVNGQNVDLQGDLRPDLAAPDSVPVTELGPVLHAAVLEGLPTACEPIPEPDAPIKPPTNADCFDVDSVTYYQYVDNLSPEFIKSDDTTWGYVATQVVKNKAYQIFFDFRNTPGIFSKGGIAVVQSKDPYPGHWASSAELTAWWETVNSDQFYRVRLSTRSGSASNLQESGDQIIEYGKSSYNTLGDKRNPIVETKLGLTDAMVSDNVLDISSQATDVAYDHVRAWQGETAVLGVSGIGVIQVPRMDCSLGQHVTVFISTRPSSSVAGTKRSFGCVIVHEVEKVAGGAFEEEVKGEDLCTGAGSRAYQQGAKVRIWRGHYFHTHKEFGKNNGGRVVDNIYFPYNYPNVCGYYHPTHSPNGTAKSTHPSKYSALDSGVYLMSSYNVTSLSGRWGGTNSEHTTAEFKGYFQAPYDGTYQFYGASDDAVWVWVSSKFAGLDSTSTQGSSLYGVPYTYTTQKQLRIGVNDLGKDVDGNDVGEYFVEDGCRIANLACKPVNDVNDEYMQSKNYHRDNCVLHTGWQSTSSDGRTEWGVNTLEGAALTQRVGVKLKAGDYYFVRAITGNDDGPGWMDIRWSIDETGVTGTFTFSGKQCPDDSPPAAAPGSPTGMVNNNLIGGASNAGVVLGGGLEGLGNLQNLSGGVVTGSGAGGIAGSNQQEQAAATAAASAPAYYTGGILRPYNDSQSIMVWLDGVYPQVPTGVVLTAIDDANTRQAYFPPNFTGTIPSGSHLVAVNDSQWQIAIWDQVTPEPQPDTTTSNAGNNTSVDSSTSTSTVTTSNGDIVTGASSGSSSTPVSSSGTSAVGTSDAWNNYIATNPTNPLGYTPEQYDLWLQDITRQIRSATGGIIPGSWNYN